MEGGTNVKEKELDSIALTSIAAKEAGMSYGKYVALFGVVREQEKEEIVPPVRDRICKECGRPFLPTTGRMKFCSKECCDKNAKMRYLQRKREKITSIGRTCVICGKPIPESRSLSAKTCSDECGERLHFMNKAVSKRKNRANKADCSYLEKRTCPICGEEFIPAVHNQKYCSRKCFAYANNQRSKKNNMIKKEQRKANRNDR